MDAADVLARSATDKDVDIWDFACCLCLLAAVDNACAGFATEVCDVVEDANIGSRTSSFMHRGDPLLLAGLDLASKQLLEGSP